MNDAPSPFGEPLARLILMGLSALFIMGGLAGLALTGSALLLASAAGGWKLALGRSAGLLLLEVGIASGGVFAYLLARPPRAGS